MRIPIIDTANIGIVQDTPPSEAPLNSWTYLRNLDLVDGALLPAKGGPATFVASVEPQFLLPVSTTSTRYLLVAGASEVHIENPSATFDITPTVPLAGTVNKWSGGTIGSVPFVNNGAAAPHMWLPQTTGTILAPLTNWPSGWTCRAMRTFSNSLIALGPTKGGTDYPHQINWSHPADPGTVPSSWDVTDPSKDAGEYPLLDSEGFVVDGLAMRNSFTIGKEDSVYSMRFIGGTQIFRFDRLFSDSGLLGLNCMTNVTNKADKQVIWALDDILLHNGSEGESLLTRRTRRWLFNLINTSALASCFVTRHAESAEIWFCFPPIGETVPSLALVWNWMTNAIWLRDIPPSNCASTGQYRFTPAGSGETWSTDTEDWFEDVTTWDQRLFSAAANQTLLGAADDSVYWIGSGESWPWDSFAYSAERLSMPVMGDYKGRPIVDIDAVKVVLEVWPRVQLPAGATMQVEVGSQMNLSDPVQWQAPQVFNPALSPKVNSLATGRYLSVRFSGTSRGLTKILGFDLDIEMVSKY